MALKDNERSFDVKFAAAEAKRKFWNPIANIERMAMMKNLNKCQYLIWWHMT